MNTNLIPALVIIGALLSILLVWFGFDREITRGVYVEYVQNQDYEKTINLFSSNNLFFFVLFA